MVQTSAAGDVPVDVDLAGGMAWMEQLPPSFGNEFEDRAAVARAACLEPHDLVDGLPVVAGTTGLPHLMVAVRDEATLRRARRDDAGCGEVCAAAEAESLYLFTVRGDGDVMARMFDRGANIGEDPATGSAAGPLGAYLAEHHLAGLPGSVVVAQGEMVGRPSFLHVEVEPRGDSFAVRVGGGVRIVGEGIVPARRTELGGRLRARHARRDHRVVAGGDVHLHGERYQRVRLDRRVARVDRLAGEEQRGRAFGGDQLAAHVRRLGARVLHEHLEAGGRAFAVRARVRVDRGHGEDRASDPLDGRP